MKRKYKKKTIIFFQLYFLLNCSILISCNIQWPRFFIKTVLVKWDMLVENEIVPPTLFSWYGDCFYGLPIFIYFRVLLLHKFSIWNFECGILFATLFSMVILLWCQTVLWYTVCYCYEVITNFTSLYLTNRPSAVIFKRVCFIWESLPLRHLCMSLCVNKQ